MRCVPNIYLKLSMAANRMVTGEPFFFWMVNGDPLFADFEILHFLSNNSERPVDALAEKGELLTH